MSEWKQQAAERRDERHTKWPEKKPKHSRKSGAKPYGIATYWVRPLFNGWNRTPTIRWYETEQGRKQALESMKKDRYASYWSWWLVDREDVEWVKAVNYESM